jgi:hypothetical protein
MARVEAALAEQAPKANLSAPATPRGNDSVAAKTPGKDAKSRKTGAVVFDVDATPRPSCLV